MIFIFTNRQILRLSLLCLCLLHVYPLLSQNQSAVLPLRLCEISSLSDIKMVVNQKGIYKINSVIDLHGGSILLPEGSILEFSGGVIANGTITGNNVFVTAPAYQIFADNLSIQGSFYSQNVFVEWFGARNDGLTDCSDAIKKAIDFGGNITLQSGVYLIRQQIILGNNVHIKGVGSHNHYTNTRLCFAVPGGMSAFANNDAHNFNTGQCATIEDLIIEPLDWSNHEGPGIDLTRPIHMKNVVVQKFPKPNMIIHHDATSEGPYNSVFISCHFQLSGSHGVVVGRGGNSVTFISCMFIANGSSSFGDRFPVKRSDYDGLLVTGREEDYFGNGTVNTYGYDLNKLYPPYSIENLTIIGSTSSHNSRYGWNFSDVCNSTINAGYAESNLGKKQVFIGNYVNKCNFLFNNTSIEDIERRGDYYRRQNNLFAQGRIFSTSDSDGSYRGLTLSNYEPHVDKPYNNELVLFETETSRISLNADYEHNQLDLCVSDNANLRIRRTDGSVVNLYDLFNITGAEETKSSRLVSPETSMQPVCALKEVGLFEERPQGDNIPIGYEYFCTDRGKKRKGLILYYSGNNKWVNALGKEIK